MAFSRKQRSQSLFLISEGQFYAKPNLKLERLEKDYSTLKIKENEDQIELRRLRTENSLLHERIEKLETAEAKLIHQNKESITLVDKLVQDQAILAKKVEMSHVLKRELNIVKHQLLETDKKLFDAENTIERFCNPKRNIERTVSLDREQGHTILKHLQGELTAARLKEAEDAVTIRELRQKITDLEDAYMERVQQSSSKDKNRKTELRQLQEELLALKMNEARAVADLEVAKQKISELETQNQTCCNQIRRIGEENTELKLKLEEAAEQEKILQTNIRDLIHKIDDAEAKRQEEVILEKIRNAENCHEIAELKQKIADINIQQKEELFAASQLNDGTRIEELEKSLKDLQHEMFLCENTKPGNCTLVDSHTENNTDEEIAAEIEESKNLSYTFSDIINGRNCSTRNFVDITEESTPDFCGNFPLAPKAARSGNFSSVSIEQIETHLAAKLEIRGDTDDKLVNLEASSSDYNFITSNVNNEPKKFEHNIALDYPKTDLPEITKEFVVIVDDLALKDAYNDNYLKDTMNLFLDSKDLASEVPFPEVHVFAKATATKTLNHSTAFTMGHNNDEEVLYKTGLSKPDRCLQKSWELYDEIVEVNSNNEIRVLSRNSTDGDSLTKNSYKCCTVNSHVCDNKYWATMDQVKDSRIVSSSPKVFSKNDKKSGEQITIRNGDKPKNKRTTKVSDKMHNYTKMNEIPHIAVYDPSSYRHSASCRCKDGHFLDFVLKESTI